MLESLTTFFSFFRKISADAKAALQLKGFYEEVASPLLTHLIVKYKGANVNQTTKLE